MVGLIYFIFVFIMNIVVITLLMKTLFGTTVSSTGYDDMDFFTSAGAFQNGVSSATVIPCLLLAALIVRDRPISSYFSSMGGWRWTVFLKTLAAAFVLIGIPTIVSLLMHGKTGDVKFTIAGFIIITLLLPLQGIAEELIYRGYIMQTVSSWFMLPAAGIIVQLLIFTAVHPYNVIGRIEILVSALLFALVCIFSRGIEASSAMHIMYNMSGIYMAGFGYGLITAEQTIPSSAFHLICKIVFFLFILYADKKLHWFDKVRYDDVEKFNAQKR